MQSCNLPLEAIREMMVQIADAHEVCNQMGHCTSARELSVKHLEMRPRMAARLWLQIPQAGSRPVTAAAQSSPPATAASPAYPCASVMHPAEANNMAEPDVSAS